VGGVGLKDAFISDDSQDEGRGLKTREKIHDKSHSFITTVLAFSNLFPLLFSSPSSKQGMSKQIVDLFILAMVHRLIIRRRKQMEKNKAFPIKHNRGYSTSSDFLPSKEIVSEMDADEDEVENKSRRWPSFRPENTRRK